VKRLGVVAKTDAAQAPGALRALSAWATRRGLTLLVEKEAADLVPELHLPTARKADLPSQSDLVVVLGGDGTLLSMARAIGDLAIPIVGVNLGDLGFLSATTLDEMIPALEALLRDEMVIEERMMLATRVHRGGKVVGEWLALNDAVITKAAVSRIINLSVSIEDQHAILYRADGLIVSTPTGSTAYSLSAGGPILYPTTDGIVITPICSHTLTNRPIVVPGGHHVEIRLLASQEVMLTVDGQLGFGLREDDIVEVGRARAAIRLVRFKDFFSVLRTKLKWGER
jgi:NAD+ kinase